MTWFKVDDQIADHPKVMALADDRLAGLGLWTICGTYCAKHLTDGYVPHAVAVMYAGAKWHRLIAALVRVGLFVIDGDGYRMHDYGEYQPSRQKVLAERASKRAAGQAGGQASAQASAQARATAPATPSGSESAQPPSRTRPVPIDVQMYIQPTDLYFEKVGRKPGQKERDWLEDLHVRFSRTELVHGMRATPKGRDYLKRLDAFMEGRSA